MKNKVLKKRINNWLAASKWQINYINGHHKRATLLSKGILFKYCWQERSVEHLKELAKNYCCANKLAEKSRLNTLWGLKNVFIRRN